MGSKMYNHYGNWQSSVGVYCFQWTTAKLQFLLVNKTRNEKLLLGWSRSGTFQDEKGWEYLTEVLHTVNLFLALLLLFCWFHSLAVHSLFPSPHRISLRCLKLLSNTSKQKCLLILSCCLHFELLSPHRPWPKGVQEKGVSVSLERLLFCME